MKVATWKICRLVPKTEADKKGARKLHHSVLGAMEAHMSLMIREGGVGAIGTADEATMGYYVINGSASHIRYKRRQRACLE